MHQLPPIFNIALIPHLSGIKNLAAFTPTLQDVDSALAILALLRLPNELALRILDQARYWMEVELSSKDHAILMDGDSLLE